MFYLIYPRTKIYMIDGFLVLVQNNQLTWFIGNCETLNIILINSMQFFIGIIEVSSWKLSDWNVLKPLCV